MTRCPDCRVALVLDNQGRTRHADTGSLWCSGGPSARLADVASELTRVQESVAVSQHRLTFQIAALLVLAVWVALRLLLA